MNIHFSDERMPSEKVTRHMEEAAALCLTQEGIDPARAEISVTFVDCEEIRELNRIYRGKDTVTDVLSFPQYENPRESDDPVLLLGDVVICPEIAMVQAEEYGHSDERELVYLFVHSVYHLLGYDHQEEDETVLMREREEQILSQLGLGR